MYAKPSSSDARGLYSIQESLSMLSGAPGVPGLYRTVSHVSHPIQPIRSDTPHTRHTLSILKHSFQRIPWNSTRRQIDKRESRKGNRPSEFELYPYLAIDTIRCGRYGVPFRPCLYPYVHSLTPAWFFQSRDSCLYNYDTLAGKTPSRIHAVHLFVCSIGKRSHVGMLAGTYTRTHTHIHTHTHNARIYARRNLFSLEYWTYINYQQFTINTER